MGSYRSFLLAAPLLLAAPVHAQQADDAAPPPGILQPAPAQPSDTRRQGPELDVFRAPATTVAPPPIVAPTITPTPVPTPVPTPAQPTARPAPRPAPRAQPAAEPRATRAPAPTPAAQPAPIAPPQARAPVAAPPAAVPAAQPVSPPTSNATAPVPTEATTPSAAAPADGSFWQWIMDGALALLALAAILLMGRKGNAIAPEADIEEAAPAPEPLPEPLIAPQPEPAPQAAPAPIPAPPLMAEPTPPAPEAATPEPAASEPAATDRPWLDMGLEITQARFSIMGVTITYELLLHNRGDQPAQDIMVRGIIGNAGAQQQDLLQSFLGGHSGMPLHASVAIEPGETRRLMGELRLSPDEITPVTMGQRSLLIPLAAFDAAYRWGPEEGEPIGHGRTARAFILGQEQEPPADRLAPLRLDQGPRHYRRPAARAAAELTPA